MPTVDARSPYPFAFDPATTALLVIDMQRDFLEPGGFGESLGNDVSQLRRTIEPLRRVLAACARGRAAGHPHPRGPPARPVRLPAGEARPRRARACASATPARRAAS